MSNVNKGLAPGRPTIPAEVADAIEGLRNPSNGPAFSNEKILAWAIEGDSALVTTLCTIPFDTLLAALVNGYTRELTEEEKRAESERELARDYDYHRGGAGRYNTAEEDDAFADGIEHALDVIGVKIEGVNA